MADIDLDALEQEALDGKKGPWLYYGHAETILSLIALVRAGKENEKKAWIAGRDAAAEFLIEAARVHRLGKYVDMVMARELERHAEGIRALTQPAETSP